MGDARPGSGPGGRCRGCRRTRHPASRSASPSARWCRARSARRTRCVAREPVADDELAARRRGAARPDPDRHAHDHAAVAQQRRGRARRSTIRRVRDGRRRHPARRAGPSPCVPFGSAGEPHPHPQRPARPPAREREDDVRRVLRRARAQRRRRAARRAAAGARGRRRRAAPPPSVVSSSWPSGDRRADRERRSARRGSDGDRRVARGAAGARARGGAPARSAPARPPRPRTGATSGERRPAAVSRCTRAISGAGSRELRLAAAAVRTTKCVSSTIASVARFERGSSNASAAGISPASRRIQAAWRASTEWMASAGHEVGAALDQRRLGLVGRDREVLEGDRGLAEALGVLGRAAEVEARAA